MAFTNAHISTGAWSCQCWCTLLVLSNFEKSFCFVLFCFVQTYKSLGTHKRLVNLCNSCTPQMNKAFSTELSASDVVFSLCCILPLYCKSVSLDILTLLLGHIWLHPFNSSSTIWQVGSERWVPILSKLKITAQLLAGKLYLKNSPSLQGQMVVTRSSWVCSQLRICKSHS